MKEVIFTDKATKPTSTYSQAVKAGNQVYLAGVCGDDPVTGKIMGDGDIAIEARYAMENLRNTIEAAGGCMNDLVMVQIYITDIEKMDALNPVYASYFENGYLPARIAMEVSRFAGGANLEINAFAVIE